MADTKPPTKRKRKATWEQIGLEYIQGDDDVTQHSLATKHGMTRSTLSMHASRDNWRERRRQFRSTVVAKTEHKKTEQASDKIVAELGDRTSLFHDACVDMVDKARRAIEGREAASYATAAGIFADKLHKELGMAFGGVAGMGTATYSEEVTARRTWINDLFPAGQGPYASVDAEVPSDKG